MNKQSQCKAILSDLQAGKKITPLDAFLNHGCMRLGARVYDLRRQGYAIQTSAVTTTTGKRIAQYSLMEGADYS